MIVSRFRSMFLIFVLALLPYVCLDQARAEGLNIGDVAPDFSLSDQEGNSVKLSDYKGKVVVLEWTNPDCPFVRRHYREGTMESLAKRYAGKEVVWVAINSTHFYNIEKNKTWVDDQTLAYPVLDDKEGLVGKLYGAKTTPDMYVINPSGQVVYRGAIDSDPHGELPAERVNYVDQAITNLLAGHNIQPKQTAPYGCSVKYKS